ncbi:MAG: YgdI/YgdR family lipoprotein [gamma proteobacterium symbiont of Lucinoma myriamae]|nr:YgdI/YgdR family lipoprotein [gamma proteobacterium symbiont of Lucinoma myriamae]
MKSSILIATCLWSLLFLSGCATPHTITLKDGTIIETPDKPKFNRKTDFYEYKDLTGKKVQLNKSKILNVKEM